MSKIFVKETLISLIKDSTLQVFLYKSFSIISLYVHIRDIISKETVDVKRLFIRKLNFEWQGRYKLNFQGFFYKLQTKIWNIRLIQHCVQVYLLLKKVWIFRNVKNSENWQEKNLSKKRCGKFINKVLMSNDVYSFISKI